MPHEDGVAVCEAERHCVAEPLPLARCVAVTLALLHGVDVGQPLALPEGENETLLVTVRDPHEDGVADWEAVVHSVAEPLPDPQCEAVILALPLGVAVGQSVALTEAENETLLVAVLDAQKDGEADSEAVVHSVGEPLLDAQCVGVMLELPLIVEVRQTVALTEGEKEALLVAVREPQDDGVAECEDVAHSVTEPLLDAQWVGVLRKLPLVVEVVKPVALTKGEKETLLVMVWEPHDDGVAECEAEVHRVVKPLLVAHSVEEMLALPLGVDVGQSLALAEGENEMLLVTLKELHDDGVAECDAVAKRVAEPLPVAHCVAVVLALPQAGAQASLERSARPAAALQRCAPVRRILRRLHRAAPFP